MCSAWPHKAATVLSCPSAPDLAESCQGTDDAEKGVFPSGCCACCPQLPVPFSSSDFSEPLIRSSTFISPPAGSGSFTPRLARITPRSKAGVAPAPGKSGSRPCRDRDGGSSPEPCKVSGTQGAPSAAPQGSTGHTGRLLALPSLRLQEQGASLDQLSKEKGLGRRSSLFPRLCCTMGAELQCRLSRGDPEWFQPLEETLFLDPSHGQSPRALGVSRVQFWANSLIGSKRRDLGAVFRGRGGILGGR